MLLLTVTVCASHPTPSIRVQEFAQSLKRKVFICQTKPDGALKELKRRFIRLGFDVICVSTRDLNHIQQSRKSESAGHMTLNADKTSRNKIQATNKSHKWCSQVSNNKDKRKIKLLKASGRFIREQDEPFVRQTFALEQQTTYFSASQETDI